MLCCFRISTLFRLTEQWQCSRFLQGLATWLRWFTDLFSREPQLYKRVCPSVGPSVGPSVRNLFFFGGQKRRRRTNYAVYPALFRCVLAPLYEGGCVRPSVRWSVCPLVRWSVTFFFGGQRRSGEQLISCIRTCLDLRCYKKFFFP